MAGNLLYSQEDVDNLLEVRENWVPITESLIKKNTTVWDGTSRAIFKIIDHQAAHPDVGHAYVLRNLHTGVSAPVAMQEVHANYKKFQMSEEAKKLRESAAQAMYRVYLHLQGQPYETEDKPTPDRDAAIAIANEQHIKSGQVFVVRNTKTGDVVYRANAPPASTPGATATGKSVDDTVAELRSRKTVKLAPELLQPGLIVKRVAGGDFFVYIGPSPNDKTRHVFTDLRTGNEEPPIHQAIIGGVYQAVVPYEDDLVYLVPAYPRGAYAEIVHLYGDVYNGAKAPPSKTTTAPTPEPTPTGGTVVDVSGTPRRTIGKDAAERGIQKGAGSERYAVQYFQKNWTSPRLYEKSYKSEYQATRRAEGLLAEPDVAWTSVIDTKKKNERVVVFPPGFDPDAPYATPPDSGTTYVVKTLAPSGTWAEFGRVYKTLSSAESRARQIITTGKGDTVRAEVIERPSNRLMHVVNLKGIDLKTFGVVQPDDFDQVEVLAGELTATETHTLRPTAPVPALAPMDAAESLKALGTIIPLRPREARGETREELTLTVARKLIALACVSAISRYNVSVAEATIICQENGERLEMIAMSLSRNEIDLYTAIQRIDNDIVRDYDLTDIRVSQTPPQVVEGVEGAGDGTAIDLGPAIANAVKAELAKRTTQRVSMMSRSSGTVSRDEVTEVAYELTFGKRKRPGSRADVTLIFISMGQATPERIWDDYEIAVKENKRDGMAAQFYLSMTSQGYVLRQEEGKAYPATGFMKVVQAMRTKYGADIIVDGDTDQIDFDLLM